jgi:hypothetical protein
VAGASVVSGAVVCSTAGAAEYQNTKKRDRRQGREFEYFSRRTQKSIPASTCVNIYRQMECCQQGQQQTCFSFRGKE